MTKYRTGLVVGKFAPLHLGHEHVIRTAFSECEQIVILSYSRPEFPGCEPDRRAAWLAARFPDAIRIVLDHTTTALPNNSASDKDHRAFCAAQLRQHLDMPIDAIFTSEDYGPGFASDLNQRQGKRVVHRGVDPARDLIPISGTKIRSDIHRHREFLSPEVYASFVQRVALLGGESTGKSSLAIALANEFDTNYVAEYGRELWESKRGKLAFEDLLAIAQEQVRREETALLLPTTRRFLFCDTTPLTTLFYSQQMFNKFAPELETLSKRPYQQTILCDDDFPFVQDGTRATPDFRVLGQAWYHEHLVKTPHILTSGKMNQRIELARRFLQSEPNNRKTPESSTSQLLQTLAYPRT